MYPPSRKECINGKLRGGLLILPAIKLSMTYNAKEKLYTVLIKRNTRAIRIRSKVAKCSDANIQVADQGNNSNFRAEVVVKRYYTVIMTRNKRR